MKRKKLNIVWIILGILMFVIVVTLGCIKLYRVKQARQCGILLAFDDYSPGSWTEHLELFDKYNVHVTFFVAWDEPTEFCYKALEKGHEIGFHTIGHTDVTDMDEEELQRCVIDPIETFRNGGIEMTSFAYPYGFHDDETDERLLEYYKVVRGAWYYEVHSKADLRHGFVEAYSIDNIHFETDEEFQAKIDQILQELSDNVGAVTCLYSHAIDVGDWCVKPERLEYLFQKADEHGLKFYTFKELQNN